MAENVFQHCFTPLSALVMNRTYGNAVTVDGMCITLNVTVIFGMWVLIVTDVRHAVIDIGLEMLLI
jgi:hypothetical protein